MEQCSQYCCHQGRSNIDYNLTYKEYDYVIKCFTPLPLNVFVGGLEKSRLRGGCDVLMRSMIESSIAMEHDFCS